MTATRVVVNVDTTDADVWHYCTHANGVEAFQIGPDHRAVTVYLLGTIEQIHTFAHTLAAAVARHAVDEVERATIGATNGKVDQ